MNSFWKISTLVVVICCSLIVAAVEITYSIVLHSCYQDAVSHNAGFYKSDKFGNVKFYWGTEKDWVDSENGKIFMIPVTH